MAEIVGNLREQGAATPAAALGVLRPGEHDGCGSATPSTRSRAAPAKSEADSRRAPALLRPTYAVDERVRPPPITDLRARA